MTKKKIFVFASLAVVALTAVAVSLTLHSTPVKDTFFKGKNCDGKKYIIVDFGKESSEKRFAVFNKDGSEYFSCKCAHGQGGKSTEETPEFSNEIGSNCSCLGKFEVIGFYTKGYLKFLKLRGLDKSNSNAEKRGICIHNSKTVTAFKHIPFKNIPLCNASNGCFAIDNESMDELIRLYKNNDLKYIVATYNKED